MEFEEYRKYADEIIREIFKGCNENYQLNKSTERSFLMETKEKRSLSHHTKRLVTLFVVVR